MAGWSRNQFGGTLLGPLKMVKAKYEMVPFFWQGWPGLGASTSINRPTHLKWECHDKKEGLKAALHGATGTFKELLSRVNTYSGGFSGLVRTHCPTALGGRTWAWDMQAVSARDSTPFPAYNYKGFEDVTLPDRLHWAERAIFAGNKSFGPLARLERARRGTAPHLDAFGQLSAGSRLR